MHANLLNVAATVYQELSKNIYSGTGDIAHHWRGRSARSFFGTVKIHREFLGQIAAHAAWFAKAGRDAAKTLKLLRNAYGQEGNARIGDLMKKLQAYKDAVDEAVVFCPDVESAANALLNAVKAYTDAMVSARITANEAASRAFDIEAKAIEGTPELDDLSHDRTNYPDGGGEGYVWSDAGGWR